MSLVFKEKKRIEKLANKAKEIDVPRTDFIFKYKNIKLTKTELLIACCLGIGLTQEEGIDFTDLSRAGYTKAKKRLAERIDIDINRPADLAVSSVFICLNGDFLY